MKRHRAPTTSTVREVLATLDEAPKPRVARKRATRVETRIVDETAFVLHSYPYKETSLIVDALTRGHGRVALVARGAKRPRSALRGTLLAFQPLSIGYPFEARAVSSTQPGSDLHSLTRAEWLGGLRPLRGEALCRASISTSSCRSSSRATIRTSGCSTRTSGRWSRSATTARRADVAQLRGRAAARGRLALPDRSVARTPRRLPGAALSPICRGRGPMLTDELAGDAAVACRQRCTTSRPRFRRPRHAVAVEGGDALPAAASSGVRCCDAAAALDLQSLGESGRAMNPLVATEAGARRRTRAVGQSQQGRAAAQHARADDSRASRAPRRSRSRPAPRHHRAPAARRAPHPRGRRARPRRRCSATGRAPSSTSKAIRSTT